MGGLIMDHIILVLALVLICLVVLVAQNIRSVWAKGRRLERRRQPWMSFLGSLAALVISVAALLLVGANAVSITPGLLELRELNGQPAPTLRYTSLEGDTPGALADHRGQVVLVNLWATWCPPCRKEMPDLDRLQQQYRDQGLVVLQISNEPRDTITGYLEKQPMTTTHGYVANFPWPIAAFPTTYIVDREGVIRQSMVGGRSFKHFERAVAKLL